MTIPHAQPGDVIDVRPLADKLAISKTSTLFKSADVEVIRLVLPAGKVLSEHKAPGVITVHCLEGKMVFTAMGKTNTLQAGELLYLPAGEPHGVEAIEDSSFLLTIILSRKKTVA